MNFSKVTQLMSSSLKIQTHPFGSRVPAFSCPRLRILVEATKLGDLKVLQSTNFYSSLEIT